MDEKTSVHELKEDVKKFCEEREWDSYHNAKDLAIGVITEASELLEHFRFKTEKQSDDKMRAKDREAVADEVADVLYFVLRIAQRFDIDLTTELRRKIKKNAEKYPAEKYKGRRFDNHPSVR